MLKYRFLHSKNNSDWQTLTLSAALDAAFTAAFILASTSDGVTVEVVVDTGEEITRSVAVAPDLYSFNRLESSSVADKDDDGWVNRPIDEVRPGSGAND